MADQTLKCCDCSSDFIFSAAEQEFYRARNLTNLPKRCPNCLMLARAKRAGKDMGAATEVNCQACGVLTKVPFKPQGYKPVYCASCFKGLKQA